MICRDVGSVSPSPRCPEGDVARGRRARIGSVRSQSLFYSTLFNFFHTRRAHRYIRAWLIVFFATPLLCHSPLPCRLIKKHGRRRPHIERVHTRRHGNRHGLVTRRNDLWRETVAFAPEDHATYPSQVQNSVCDKNFLSVCGCRRDAAYAMRAQFKQCRLSPGCRASFFVRLRILIPQLAVERSCPLNSMHRPPQRTGCCLSHPR